MDRLELSGQASLSPVFAIGPSVFTSKAAASGCADRRPALLRSSLGMAGEHSLDAIRDELGIVWPRSNRPLVAKLRGRLRCLWQGVGEDDLQVRTLDPGAGDQGEAPPRLTQVRVAEQDVHLPITLLKKVGGFCFARRLQDPVSTFTKIGADDHPLPDFAVRHHDGPGRRCVRHSGVARQFLNGRDEFVDAKGLLENEIGGDQRPVSRHVARRNKNLEIASLLTGG